MATQDLRVAISGGVVSLDAWRQAMEADESALPSLNEAQKEAARIVAMPEKEYARGILADEIGKRRQQEIGKSLGATISQILEQSGGAWKLESLLRKGTEHKWIANIVSGNRSDEVEIPIDLAEDVVESSDLASRERLERLLNARLESPARRAVS
jgi:hypothetical protein